MAPPPLITALLLLPFMGHSIYAMPQPTYAADTFSSITELLPCQQDIADVAQYLGFRVTGQTQMDTDYIDIIYSDAADQSRLTVALENTPIGAQYSVSLDIPQTDQIYANSLVTALRLNWSLPQGVQLQTRPSGTAQNWTISLPNGAAQITVRHDAMTTQVIGILSPLKPGSSLPC